MSGNASAVRALRHRMLLTEVVAAGAALCVAAHVTVTGGLFFALWLSYSLLKTWHGAVLTSRVCRTLPISAMQAGRLAWRISVFWPCMVALLLAALHAALGADDELWSSRLDDGALAVFTFAGALQIPVLLALITPQPRSVILQALLRRRMLIGRMTAGSLVLALLAVYSVEVEQPAFDGVRDRVLAALAVLSAIGMAATYRYADIAVLNLSGIRSVPKSRYAGVWGAVYRAFAGRSETITNASLKAVVLLAALAILALVAESHDQSPHPLLALVLLFSFALLVMPPQALDWRHIRLLKLLPLTDRARFLRALLATDIATLALPLVLVASASLPVGQALLATAISTVAAGLSLVLINNRLQGREPYDSDGPGALGCVVLLAFATVGAVVVAVDFGVADGILGGLILPLAVWLLYYSLREFYFAVKAPMDIPGSPGAAS